MWRTEKVRAPSTHVSMCSPPSGPCCHGAHLNAGWCRVRAQRTTTETCVSYRLNLTFELPAQLPDDPTDVGSMYPGAASWPRPTWPRWQTTAHSIRRTWS